MLGRLLDWLRGREGHVIGQQVDDPRLSEALSVLARQTGRDVQVHWAETGSATLTVAGMNPREAAEAAGRAGVFPGVSYSEDGTVGVNLDGGEYRWFESADGQRRPWMSPGMIRQRTGDES